MLRYARTPLLDRHLYTVRDTHATSSRLYGSMSVLPCSWLWGWTFISRVLHGYFVMRDYSAAASFYFQRVTPSKDYLVGGSFLLSRV